MLMTLSCLKKTLLFGLGQDKDRITRSRSDTVTFLVGPTTKNDTKNDTKKRRPAKASSKLTAVIILVSTFSNFIVIMKNLIAIITRILLELDRGDGPDLRQDYWPTIGLKLQPARIIAVSANRPAH
jgi:hypothetical protein